MKQSPDGFHIVHSHRKQSRRKSLVSFSSSLVLMDTRRGQSGEGLELSEG